VGQASELGDFPRLQLLSLAKLWRMLNDVGGVVALGRKAEAYIYSFSRASASSHRAQTKG
jgi:hypothetical protein